MYLTMSTTYRADVRVSPDGPGDDHYCPYANVTIISGYDSNNKVISTYTYVDKAPRDFEDMATLAATASLAAAFRSAAADIAAAYEGQF